MMVDLRFIEKAIVEGDPGEDWIADAFAMLDEVAAYGDPEARRTAERLIRMAEDRFILERPGDGAA